MRLIETPPMLSGEFELVVLAVESFPAIVATRMAAASPADAATSSVNHEDRVIRVEHIDHLQESAATSLALDQELIFA